MPRAILTRIDFEAYGTHEDDVFAEGIPPADHDIPLTRHACDLIGELLANLGLDLGAEIFVRRVGPGEFQFTQ
jgi:hypothetical protein